MRTGGPHAKDCTPGSSMRHGLCGRPSEAEHVEHRERDRVVGVAEELLGPHRGDAPREGRQQQHELVGGEAGLDARGVETGAALRTRRLQLAPEVGVEGGGEDEVGHGRGHRVAPAGQDPGQVGHGIGRPGLPGRGVADAVGLKGEQGVPVVGGRHPDRVDPRQLTGVDPHLGRVVDPDPDQLQVRPAGDGSDGDRPHPARGPPHDSQRRRRRQLGLVRQATGVVDVEPRPADQPAGDGGSGALRGVGGHAGDVEQGLNGGVVGGLDTEAFTEGVDPLPSGRFAHHDDVPTAPRRSPATNLSSWMVLGILHTWLRAS